MLKYLCLQTDKILEEAISLGCIPIKRPSVFSGDDSTSEEAIIHSIEYIEKTHDKNFDTIMATTHFPLRSRDFKEALCLYIEGSYDSLFLLMMLQIFFWEKDKFNKLIELNFDNKKLRQTKKLQIIENGSFYIFDKNKFKLHKTRLFESIGEYRMEPCKIFEIDD